MNASVSPPVPEPIAGANGVLDARVVFLTHYIPTYQLPVLKELTRNISDFRVLVCTDLEPNRHEPVAWTDLNVTVQKKVTIHQRWKHSTGFNDTLYVHFPYDTLSQLRRLSPDVIMSHELGFRSLASSLYRRISRRSKLVLCTYMSERTEQGRGRLRQILRRRLVRQADALTYNGPSCLRVLDRLGAPEDRSFLLPYAADPAVISTGQRKGPLPGTLNLLCIGQLSERKGVGLLREQITQFAAKTPHLQIRLTFIGTGPLQEQLREGTLPENLVIELAGHVPAKEIGGFMREHDVMVFPTLADEWGLVVNEAMHSGLPVLGSVHAQACTTLIEDGSNGWVYDPMDDLSLGGVLSRVAEQGDRLLEVGDRARETVAHITPQWAASGAIRACQWVLNGRSR